MDKAITTALLIVISSVMAMLLFNAAYPAVVSGSEAITRMANRTSEQMQSQVEIIHGVGELDSGSFWQDTNSNGEFDVFLWVKNVGETRLHPPEQSDIFFGVEGNFVRIPYATNNSSGYPYWNWQIENAAQWTPNATLRITIHYAVPLTSGRYFAKILAPHSASDDYFMGI
jgi:archaellum component FlaG (FlaF/FlaG flagellin family)